MEKQLIADQLLCCVSISFGQLYLMASILKEKSLEETWDCSYTGYAWNGLRFRHDESGTV